MTAASIYGSPPKLLCGGKSARRTRFPWGQTGVLGQVTDTRSRGAWRGMGPSTYARVAEITSGRAISQQGLTATCKDRVHKAEAEARGGFWSGAWAHKSDEGGVTPSETTREVVPTRGNTPGGQRSPGHWVANEPGPWEDMTRIAWSNLSSGGRSWWRTSRPEGKPTGRCTTRLPSPNTWEVSWSSRRGGRQTIGARGVCGSALKLPHRWAGLLSDKWCAEPRSEPDSGNPTVRDRRAALRNVASHAYGDLVRALNFEPDNRTHGSTGGDWKRNATASPRQPPTQPSSHHRAFGLGGFAARDQQDARRRRSHRAPLGYGSARPGEWWLVVRLTPFLSFHSFDPSSTRRPGLERLAKVLCVSRTTSPPSNSMMLTT